MSTGYLSDVCALIVEQGLGKARAQILTKQLFSKGGTVEKTLQGNVTHLFVGNNIRLSRIPQLLKITCLPEHVSVLRADWLSTCLVTGERIGHAQYIVQPELSPLSSPTKHGHTPQSSPTKPSHTPQSSPGNPEHTLQLSPESSVAMKTVPKEQLSQATVSTEDNVSSL